MAKTISMRKVIEMEEKQSEKVKTTIMMPRELLARVDAIAEEWAFSRSTTMQVLIREIVEQHEREKRAKGE